MGYRDTPDDEHTDDGLSDRALHVSQVSVNTGLANARVSCAGRMSAAPRCQLISIQHAETSCFVNALLSLVHSNHMTFHPTHLALFREAANMDQDCGRGFVEGGGIMIYDKGVACSST